MFVGDAGSDLLTSRPWHGNARVTSSFWSRLDRCGPSRLEADAVGRPRMPRDQESGQKAPLYSAGSVSPTRMSVPHELPGMVGVGSTRTSAPVWGASTIWPSPT